MKIVHFIVLLTALLPASMCFSAYTLEGNVLGVDGKPVDGVTVLIYNDFHDEIARGYSDHKGQYQIKNLPSGTYTLEAKKSKFPRYSTSIQLGGPENTVYYHDINFSDIMVHPGVTKSDLIQLYLPSDYNLKSSYLNDYRKGLDLIYGGNLKKAEKHYQDLAKKDPKFARTYLQLAVIAKEQGKKDEWFELLQKSSSLNPSDPMPLLHLADYYIKEKNLEMAEKQINAAEKIDDSLFQIHILRGELLYYQGNLNDSQMEFTKVIHINLPPDQEALVKRFMGEIDLSKGRLANARNHFTAYLKNNPNADDAEDIRKKIREIEIQLMKEQ